MRTKLFLPLFLILADSAAATEPAQRLDNRSLRANFRVFLDTPQGLRNQVTIVEHGEQTTRFLESCPERVQIGGVQIDDNRKISLSSIESTTYITDARISVFCE